MKKISSDSTWFYKKVFPAMWFGLLAAFFVVSVTGNGLSTGGWKFLLMPCLMAIVGFFVMKNVVWDLVDEVHDCGDSLLVRNGSEEERIPLSNIINVNASTQTRPPRITLRLARSRPVRQPGRILSAVENLLQPVRAEPGGGGSDRSCRSGAAQAFRLSSRDGRGA